MTDYLTVPRERVGMELDEFLCLTYPLLNKGFLRRQIRAGNVLVDGNSALPNVRLKSDQVLIIDIDESEGLPEAPVAPKAEVPVLYEDEDVLVVDKPAGLAVEPERWARGEACLSGALLELSLVRAGVDRNAQATTEAHASIDFRPRLVHRIDKETSGIVLVAKNLECERRLREAFEAGTIKKSYLALVEGEYPLEDGESDVLDLPIAPDRRRTGRMQVSSKGGKESRTRVSVEQRFRGFTLMRCSPITGRTHQIRVHLSDVGFPLCVDGLYGRRDEFFLSEIKTGYRAKKGRPESPLIDRLTLHAAEIEFPSEEGPVHVEAELPRDYGRALKQLTKVRPPRTGRGGYA